MKTQTNKVSHGSPKQYAFVQCNDIKTVKEDLSTIKIALGYKEKSNGDFREEVEEETKSLNSRMRELEINTAGISSTLKILILLFIALIGLIAGLLYLLFQLL